MYSCTKTCTLTGLEGYPVDVEVDLSNGMPRISLVGLAETAVRESTERVKSAIRNSGYTFPNKNITINLAPANLRKDGSHLDLPIAVAILSCDENLDMDYSSYVFLGELTLDGKINKIQGALPMIISMRERGYRKFIVPYENRHECSIISDVEIYPANTLEQVISFIKGESQIERCFGNLKREKVSFDIDFSDIKGQENLKRAMEISACAKSNILILGSPGSGKTMAAKRFPTILPELDFEEAIEVTKIYSISGILDDKSLITKPPFRAPHHTASAVSLIGGGKIPRPGEISLANKGVLFLDELPEFSKSVLEVLRQPMESKEITISRANANVKYPCDFILIVALNPCPCGYHNSKIHECNCSPYEIQRYLSKISHPLLDRIDIHLEVEEVQYDDISSDRVGESSAVIRERVKHVREIQKDRFKEKSYKYNSEIPEKEIKKYCELDSSSKKILEMAYKKYSMSARTYNKILKIARTIADMDNSDKIKEDHLLESIQYRTMGSKYWGN
ncbi:YifB family Mg chelatase-like AAA ATPase [Peptoniphilus sp. MSJ-1]|uniref:YifB family Mg chelatase-like AAA ATPase n=1 Tax=Peptoniphilus ovalis TaxID=2841503 RepID=A0ABS6FLD2_9FIRM|nr:YifB family Mg chelatase-like AAA ATPase [Peptoniphilus ovalis]MBU5670051.1 YifB family Mg chelatase-like AAA ATPase [Peptoniphilus ovalis]